MNENPNNGRLRPQDWNGFVPDTTAPEPTNADLLRQLDEIHDKLQQILDESNDRAKVTLAKLEQHISDSDQRAIAIQSQLATIIRNTTPREGK